MARFKVKTWIVRELLELGKAPYPEYLFLDGEEVPDDAVVEREKKSKQRHRMYCSKSTMRCATFHSDGICPSVRDCEGCEEDKKLKKL